MPLLSYFSIVGTVLLGLLFMSDALLPDRPPLKFSTDVYGLPVNPPTQRAVRIHNPPPTQPPDMSSPAIMFANADAPAAATPTPPAAEATTAVASAAKPRVQRVATRTAKHPKQRQRAHANKRQEWEEWEEWQEWQDRDWFAWSASERRREPESQGRREARQREFSQFAPPRENRKRETSRHETWQRETWQRETWNRSFWQRESRARAPQSREAWSPWGSIR